MTTWKFFLLYGLWSVFLCSADHADPVYKHACGKEGAQFWRKIIRCKEVANELVKHAFEACVPSKTPRQAEVMRKLFCADPGVFDEVLECYHKQLIALQDHNDSAILPSPGFAFRTCGQLIIDEADSDKRKVPGTA